MANNAHVGELFLLVSKVYGTRYVKVVEGVPKDSRNYMVDIDGTTVEVAYSALRSILKPTDNEEEA